VYVEGAINELAAAETGNPQYLGQAIKYYEEGEQLGPNRPQILYGLFDVYRVAGDTVNTERIATKILTNWPHDDRINQSVVEFLNRQKAGSPAPATKPGK
jgi:hypothetical protein